MKKLLLAILFLLLVGTNLPAQQKILSGNKVQITPLVINTELNDIGPALIDKVLYYSSINSKFGSAKHNNQFFTLYSLPMNLAEIPEQAGIKHNELNVEYNNGPITYCEATQELFITRSNFDNAKITNGIVNRKHVTLSIISYKKENNHWHYKEDFPFNSHDYSVAQPAINQSGDTLIFVSDQASTYGKTDLYITVKENGIWQTPQNMGSLINSKKNEATPFINNDGQLYFASNGQGGSGGFDLFSIKLDDFKTKRAQNLGKIINTDADEFGLCIHPSQLIGYFASNRKGGTGKDDLYCIKTANYETGTLAIQNVKKQIEALSTIVNEQLKVTENKKKEEETITQNVNFLAELEVIDKNIIPDLKISFSYRMSDEKLKLRQNVFGLYQYKLSESHALTALLEAINTSFSNELSTYIKQNKKVSIKMNGNPEVLNFSDNITYKGEFGELIEEQFVKKDSLYSVKIENGQKLIKDEFTFLRAYAAKNYISTEIKPLQFTHNNFQYVVISNEQLSTNNKWITIEFIITNAFDIFD